MRRAVVAAVLGLVVAAAARADEPVVQDVPTDGDPVTGAPKGAVTVIVASDYRCLYCRKFATTLDALAKRYPDQVRIVHKAFPLEFHDGARMLSLAACAAHRQGKFDAMERALWADYDQQRSTEDDVAADAKRLGLDVDRFRADLHGKPCADALDHEIAQLQALGVEGVPTTWVAGHRISGAQPLAKLAQMVDAALGPPDPPRR